MRLRSLLVALAGAVLVTWGGWVPLPRAAANHCGPVEQAKNPQQCLHGGSPRPATPRPTPRPTAAPPAPTPAPTAAPPHAVITPKPRPRTATTPEPLVLELTPEPTPLVATATPEILVTPEPDQTPAPEASARRRSSVNPAGWALFVAGLIVGVPVGMVSSGYARRRRKKQAIFG